MPTFHVHVTVGGATTTFLAERPTLAIGSADGNDIVLPHASVDLHHARLHLDGAGGQLVLEEPLGTPRLLNEGQEVRLGACAIRVEKVVQEADAQATFLARIRDKPDDDELRLVYRDWLLENDWEARATYLDAMVNVVGLDPDSDRFRAVSRELHEIGKDMPREWRRAVSRAPIESCDVRFELVCPKRWDQLEATTEDAVRYCGACKKAVHFVTTAEEARELADDGRCVAFDPPQREHGWRTPPGPPGRMTLMGAVAPSPSWRARTR